MIEGYNIFHPEEKTFERSKNMDFVELRVYGHYFGKDTNSPFDEELVLSKFEESECENQQGKINTLQLEEGTQNGNVESVISESKESKSKKDEQNKLTNKLGDYIGQSKV